MFYSVNSYSSASSRKGLTGLMSGLDTDELVKQMTSATRSKIATQLQKKQLSQWKQESYREVISGINEFKSKYLSYSSGKNNIMSSDFFNTKTITNSSKYVKVSGSTDAAKNMVINDIKQLAETSSFTSGKQVSSQTAITGDILENWDKSILNGQSISLQVGNSAYSISLGSSFSFRQGLDDAGKLQAIADEFNKAVQGNTELKDKFEFGVNASGNFEVKSLDATNFIISGGSEKLLSGLGLTSGGTATSSVTGTASASGLFEVKTLKDTLAGSTLNVSFNGVSKSIKFDLSKIDEYSDVNKLQSYLQTEVDKAFGANKINVQEVSGGLGFQTYSKNDIFSINSSDNKDVLGLSGALHIEGGTSTRITWNTSIKQLVATGQFADSANMKADADGNYKLKINDTVITISENATMKELQNKINSSDAGVEVTYSTTSDTFSMKAKESGAHGKVNVQSLEVTDGLVTDGATTNDLGALLFGTSANQKVTGGRDATLEVSFDGGKTSTTVTRSSNNFSLDGVTIELLGKDNNPIVDLKGANLSLNVGGTDYNITFPSDFTVDSALSGNDKVAAVLNQLNKQFVEQGLSTVQFSVNSSSGDIELSSSDGKAISINGGSSSTLLNAIGFQSGSINGNGTTTVAGKGSWQIETSAKEEIKFTVETNADEIVTKIKSFLDDYNAMVKLVNDKMSEKADSKYPPLTDEQKKDMSEDEIKKWEAKAKQGVLANDQYLSGFLTSLRQSMFNSVEGTTSSLFKMGIKTTEWSENGQLHIVDENMLKKALADDPEGISRLFTSSVEADIPLGASKEQRDKATKEATQKSGLAARLDYLLNATAGTYGGDGILISIAGAKGEYKLGQDTLSRQLKSIDVQLSSLKTKLQTEETRYYKQFSALEQYLSQMESQSSWLTQQFGGNQ